MNLQTPNLATIMTIMEVVRHMDHSSWLGQNQLPVSQPPISSNTSTFSKQASNPGSTPLTSRFESPGIDAGTDASEDRSATRELRTNTFRRQVLIPTTSRKRPLAVKPANPPPKRFRKGKERAISMDSSEHSEADELVEASDDSYSTYSSVPPLVRPRHIVARKRRGEIFLSGSGQPLRFFVQVDLHGRHTVVTNIKVCLGSTFYRKLDADGLSRKTRGRLSTILLMPTIRSCLLVLIPFKVFSTRPLL